MKKSKIPPLLREISDPPKQLYLRGSLPDSNIYTYITVVGSRKYTKYGKEVCEELIRGFADYPICIVSGLALGIDGIAHRASLKAGLPTVAIPGSGLSDEVLYPQTHLGLAREILSAGGGLLSEYEPNFKATVWSFPMRNRIMAGISKAIIVVEAEEKSGTRITARLATEYNRDVFAVPGSIFSASSEGANALLKEGATPALSSKFILEELGLITTSPIAENTDLTEKEKHILSLLKKPLERKELLKASQFPIQETNVLVSLLELKGVIKEEMGKIQKLDLQKSLFRSTS